MKRESAQDIQDRIFRNMSADKRVQVGAKLWLLAKDIVGHKIDYGPNRSKKASRASHASS